MFELTVERTFSAAHAVSVRGLAEPLHGHDWRVSATVVGGALDDDGMLCDFHAIEELLGRVCARFHNGNLNQIAPFDRLNPTAEMIARHIADRLAERLAGDGLSVASVSVGEAPGCTATYRPGGAR